ncbi:MAG: hypothetical protein KKF22_02860 [Gammaproteobacteria bacterium]|nr:hypothetical protein [Gammaproteobacteria bacterium]
MLKLIFGASVINGIGLLFQTILFFLAAATLVISDFATFSFVLATSVFASQVLMIGYSQIATRVFAKDVLMGNTFLSTLMCVLNLILIILLVFSYINSFDAGVYLSVICYLFALKFLFKRVAMGIALTPLFIFLDEVVWVILPFLYLLFGSELTEVFNSLLAGLSISLVLMFLYLRRSNVKFYLLFDFALIKFYFYQAVAIFVFLAGRLSMNRLDVLVVKQSFSELDFSAFSLAHRASYIITFVPLIISSLYSGRILKMFENSDSDGIAALRRKSFFISVGFASIFFLTFFIIGDEILKLYSDGVFYPYYLIFLLLFFAQFIFSFNGLDQSLIILSGRAKSYSYITAGCAVIFISLASFYSDRLSLIHVTLISVCYAILCYIMLSYNIKKLIISLSGANEFK